MIFTNAPRSWWRKVGGSWYRGIPLGEYPTSVPWDRSRGWVKEGVARKNKLAPMTTPTERAWSILSGGKYHQRKVAMKQAERKAESEDMRANR